MLRFKYQMIQQRIAYALICLPELCALKTQSSEIAVLRNAKLGKVRQLRQSALMKRVGFRASDFTETY